MEQFLQISRIQSVLFVYLIIGYICRKIHIFSDEMRTKMTDFVLFVTLPCMVFNSFNMEFSMSILQRSSLSLIIALLIALVSLVMAKFFYNGVRHEKKSVMQFGTVVNNAVFGGLPIVSSLYGADGIFLSSFFVIPQRILMWTVGISYFTRNAGSTKQAILKVLKMPTVVAVYLGLIRMIFQIPVPEFFNTAMKNMGSCTSPLAMVLVGAILADTKFRELFDPLVFYLAAVRQILLPGILLVALKLLGTDPVMTGMSVILTAMPAGTTTAILAKKYDADAEFASKVIFLSTILSLLTVPLICSFL